MKRSIRDLTLKELEGEIVKRGFPKYRAKQLVDWIYKKQVVAVSEIKNLPKELLRSLEKDFVFSSLILIKIHTGADNSKKFLFQTETGEHLESVYIYQGSKRHALCVSTQIGCKMKCKFCASGKMGWKRNLSAGEILDQIANVMHELKVPLDNLVYMGMGEPLDNLNAVLKSIRILRADWGFQMGWRRITISTSGLVPAIKKFAASASGEVKLAISLHGTTDEERKKIMPISKVYSLESLIQCLKDVKNKFKRQFMFEYILIKGLNDSMEDAKRLRTIARRVDAKVNLIPYNKIEGEKFERPSIERMKEIQKFLTESGITTMLRYSAGSDIGAACGQLRLIEEKHKTQNTKHK